MYQHYGLDVCGPALDIMHIQCAALIIIQRHIMGLKIIIGQMRKARVRGFAYFHMASLAMMQPNANKMASCVPILILRLTLPRQIASLCLL